MAVNNGKAQGLFHEARALAEALRAHLEWLHETGVEGLKVKGWEEAAKPLHDLGPREGEKHGRGGAFDALSRNMEAAVERSKRSLRPKVKVGSGNLFKDPAIGGARTMSGLQAAITGCRRCKLASGRRNIVFGVGDPQAEIVFVGEGPGQEEDEKGEPFVGRAGQLLTKIITNGMKLRREDVYIANIVKCRPPGNREPAPDEVAACEPFLARQIELIKPQAIIALGRVAVQVLLKTQAPIGQLRGEWQEYRGIPMMPTFHPAYLLRSPSQKALVWQDIKKVMSRLGMTV